MKKMIYLFFVSGCLFLFVTPASAVVLAPTKGVSSSAGYIKSHRQDANKQLKREKKLARLERFLQRFYSNDMSDHTQKWLYLSIFTFIIALLLQALSHAVSFSFIISLANTFAVVAIIFFVIWLIKKYA